MADGEDDGDLSTTGNKSQTFSQSSVGRRSWLRLTGGGLLGLGLGLQPANARHEESAHSSLYLAPDSEPPFAPGDTIRLQAHLLTQKPPEDDSNHSPARLSAYFQPATDSTHHDADFYGENFELVSRDIDEANTDTSGGEWVIDQDHGSGWEWEDADDLSEHVVSVTLEAADSLDPGEYTFALWLIWGGVSVPVMFEEWLTHTIDIRGAAAFELELPDRTDRPVQPGETFEIEPEISNTGGTTGDPKAYFQAQSSSFEYNADYFGPEFEVVDHDDDGGGWEVEGWSWTGVQPGETHSPSVELRVSESLDPGEYTFAITLYDSNWEREETERVTVTVGGSSGVTGKIVDVHGDPVPDTVVQVFDVESRTELDSAETDGDGRFELTDLDDQRDAETLLVAKRPVSDTIAGEQVTRHWFTTRAYGDSQLPLFEWNSDLGTIPLDREEVFPPQAPTDQIDEPLGMVSIWRFVGNEYQKRLPEFSDPTEQIYYIEVTNTNRDDSLGIKGDDIYEITTDWKYDLADGVFTLTVPEEEIEVDYGSQSSVNLGRTVTIRGAATPQSNLTVDWHPARTGLPAYESCRYLTSQPYEEISTTDAEAADRIEEGFGRMFQTLPVIGDILGLYDSLGWALGDAFEYSGEISVPVSNAQTNPNTYDNVTLGWESDTSAIDYDESSVVLSVPLRFTDPDLAAPQFLAQAEYRHQSDLGGSPYDGNGYVRIPFIRGPSGHINGESK